MERKLVTIRKIKEVNPIQGADLIEQVLIDGWKTIVKKGTFSVGDYGLYFEIDSLIPFEDERFSFINSTKTVEGVKQRYLKTIRLRDTISQGLALAISNVKEIEDLIKGKPENFLDHDFSDLLNVVKYEEPEPADNSEKKGSIPFYIQKTGEKRIQNIYQDIVEKYEDVEFYPTLKMDGSSMTVCYVNNPIYFVGREEVDEEGNPLEKEPITEQLWVGSHRMVLKDPYIDNETGEEIVSTFHKAYFRTGLETSLPKWCKDNGKQIAIQGELLGPGIQGNYEKYKEYTFKAFYVYFIDEDRRATPTEFEAICDELSLETVVIYPPIKVFKEFQTVDEIIAFADGKSINHPKREGLVFKSNTMKNGRPLSFKVISNEYLLKKK